MPRPNELKQLSVDLTKDEAYSVCARCIEDYRFLVEEPEEDDDA